MVAVPATYRQTHRISGKRTDSTTCRMWKRSVLCERLSKPSRYACVRVIAETVASLPLHVYQYTDTGSEKALEHPLYFLLHDQPNSEMTSFVMRETMLTHLLLWGNAYSQVLRNGRGHVTGLYPLLPDKMNVDRDASGKGEHRQRL